VLFLFARRSPGRRVSRRRPEISIPYRLGDFAEDVKRCTSSFALSLNFSLKTSVRLLVLFDRHCQGHVSLPFVIAPINVFSLVLHPRGGTSIGRAAPAPARSPCVRPAQTASPLSNVFVNDLARKLAHIVSLRRSLAEFIASASVRV
jgi:hypothetical protein